MPEGLSSSILIVASDWAMRMQAPTPYEREVVCMAASESIVAVGSQNHVSFVDPRVQACVSFIANAEHNHGNAALQTLSLPCGEQAWDSNHY